jgi:hypothetical protein
MTRVEEICGQIEFKSPAADATLLSGLIDLTMNEMASLRVIITKKFCVPIKVVRTHILRLVCMEFVSNDRFLTVQM